MTVQAGIWRFDGRPIAEEDLQLLAHDNSSVHFDSENICQIYNIGMIVRYFHVTPELINETQPRQFGAGDIIAWDGRLDNSEDLRGALDLPRSAVTTDLQVVTAAFERWKCDCFRRLVGDWAISVYLSSEKKVILARDFAGMKQLFFTWREGIGVNWSSLLAPLASFDRPATINPVYFAGFLTMWPNAEITPYKEIQSVPPGAYVELTPSRRNITAFWKFNPAEIRYKKQADYDDAFRALFRQAVRRRLRTSFPVLAELSGGLDSSSIVCMADDVLRKEGASTPRLDTLSCFDPEEPDEDDIHYFGAVEKQRGRAGYHVEMKGSGNALSFEFAATAPVPGFGVRDEFRTIRSKLIGKNNYRVILSGVGGDEMLGQTLDARVILADLLRHLRLKELMRLGVGWSLHTKRPFMELLMGALSMNLPSSMRLAFRKASRIPRWIDPDFAKRYHVGKARMAAAEGRWFWSAAARDSLQTLNTLRRQISTEALGSCEIWYPYLDRDLVEFLIAIPKDQLSRPGDTRFLMRRALSSVLPPEIASRRSKSGMGRCVITTLDNHWTLVQSSFANSVLDRLGYVRTIPFMEAIQTVRDGTLVPNIFQILRALAAELWLQNAIRTGIIAEPRSTDLINPAAA
jgi:asparagine synthase (glutamine-hydrolysing)